MFSWFVHYFKSGMYIRFIHSPYFKTFRIICKVMFPNYLYKETNLCLYFGSQLLVIIAVSIPKRRSVLLIDDGETAALGKQHWRKKEVYLVTHTLYATTHI